MAPTAESKVLDAVRRRPRFPTIPFETVRLGPEGMHCAYIAFAPDGHTAYVPNQDTRNLSVIATGSRTVRCHVPLEVCDDPWDMAITPDGRRGFLTNSGFTRHQRTGVSSRSLVDVMALPEVALETTIAVGVGANAVSMSADGRRAYVANTRSDEVSILDTATLRVTATVPVGRKPLAVAECGALGLLLVACQEEQDAWLVSLRDLRTAQIRLGVEQPTVMSAPLTDEKCGTLITVVQAAIHPTRPEAYVTHFDAGYVIVLDLLERAVVERIPVPRMPYGLEISPDGRWLAVTNDSRRFINLIDVDARRLVGSWQFDRAGDVTGDLLPVRLRPHTDELWIPDGKHDEVVIVRLGDMVDAADTTS